MISKPLHHQSQCSALLSLHPSGTLRACQCKLSMLLPQSLAQGAANTCSWLVICMSRSMMTLSGSCPVTHAVLQAEPSGRVLHLLCLQRKRPCCMQAWNWATSNTIAAGGLITGTASLDWQSLQASAANQVCAPRLE